jgi:uncharacterized damage-inducible protein DinB
MTPKKASSTLKTKRASSKAIKRAPSKPSPRLQDPAKLLFGDLEGELKITRRTLERVPNGKDDWRPHAKSKSLDELATHIAQLPGLGITIVTKDEYEGLSSPPQPKPADNAARLKIFDDVAREFQRLVNELTWDQAMATWTLMFRGKPAIQGPRAQILRTVFVSHLAHHRAQLGVYLRLLDISVPGMYGPSADEGPPPR